MTVQQTLKKLAPKGKFVDKVAPFIDMYAAQYGVTGQRLNHFLSQATHETDSFNTLKEYASGAAYEGRKDLGNTQPGDGIKFRGRGIFQTTGRSNYKRASQKIFGDDRLLTVPGLLEEPRYAVLSALIFWKDNGLNQYADKNDVVGMTRRINGGTNGLDHRLQLFNKIRDVFIKLANPGTAIVLLLVLISVIYFLTSKS